MTKEERLAVLQNIFHGLKDGMEYAYSRWLDEHEYEDINDYGKFFQENVKNYGGELVKMHKRPFGFTFQLDGRKYQLSMTSKKYSCNQVV